MFACVAAALCLASASPPEIFTFDEAVDYALAHHPELAAAQWSESAALGAVSVARASAMPLITGSAVAYHLSQNSTVTLRQNSIQAAVQVTVPLVAPQAWGEWTHAQTAWHVQQQRTRQIRRSLAVAVARAYFDVVLASRLVSVGDNAVEQGKAHFQYAHTRLKGGVGTELDELRADQDLAQSQKIQVSAVDVLHRREAALGVATGVDHAVTAVEVKHIATGREITAKRDDVEARADVKAALDAWRAAKEIEDDSWRDYSPTLLLRGTPFFAHPSTAILPTWGWSVSVVLMIPFYDGGARYGLADERRSVSRSRDATLALTRRLARSEARAARAALELAKQAREVSSRAAAAASQAVALATQAYRSGSTDNLAVIDAQRSDRDAATAVAIAEDTVLRARLAWLAAVGMFPP